MRTVYKTSLAALIVVVGLVWAFGRGLIRSVPQGTPSSTLPAVPALPSPPPGPLGWWGDTPSLKEAHRRAFERGASSAPATAALACIEEALGGVRVFAGVSSLRIVGSTKPTATTSTGPVANTREIGIVFPDRYRRSDVQADAGMNATRLEFVQQVLMRLPREIADVRLLQRITHESGQDRLAIDASGLDGLDATLWADLRTCMPFALEYRQASTTTAGSSDTYRIELSQYRRFGGILFPMVLRISRNGAPREDEYDSQIQVNVPLGDEYFRRSGR